jgi:MoaA/NifB/PqqE/SkfB family radical SAM enzyme
MDERGILESNRRIGRAEYLLRRAYLKCMPRFLGLVLGNACNIDCRHCYQEKNADNLLGPREIGGELRHEFLSLCPYLTGLRVQGGEALAYRGFRDLVEDLASVVGRSLLSVSTNGTLIDEEWAEVMVRLPFASLTVSIDGATPATFARLRRGAELTGVLANVERLRRWKRKLNSNRPELDSFFVVMRSNFREIPAYLELMHQHGFEEVALQTLEVNHANSKREPLLEEDERITGRRDIADLYELVGAALPRARRCFRKVRVSGLKVLFEKHGYDTAFLRELEYGLYPETEGLEDPSGDGSFELCPNPWTTLFVSENGNVHLCFLSEPVGNLCEAPLVEIWNSPRAVAKRLRMSRGAYLASGCSPGWCEHREGMIPAPANPPLKRTLLQDLSPAVPYPAIDTDPALAGLGAVRRMVAENGRRLFEGEAVVRAMDEEFQRMRRSLLVRAAARIARMLRPCG